MFTRDSAIISHNIKTPLTSISRAVGNILQLTYGQLVKSLFANGEQGFFYDTNDLSTMFQDAAGTVPVTAAGQPVGLMLDKRKGLKLGEELSKITSPFTVFRDESSVIISPSVATLSAGKTYLVVTDIADNPQGAGDWRVNGTTLNIITSVQVGAKAGRHTCLLTVIGGSNLQLFGSNVGTSITVNAVSIRELSGNHAYQTVSASRPILRQTPILGNELALNGSFDTALIGWKNITNSFAWANGAAVSTGVQGDIAQDDLCAVGRTYLLSFTISGTGGAGVYVSTAGNDIASYKDGSFTVTTTATSTQKSIRFRIFSGNAATIDNVSLKEIIGYRTDQNYLEFDGSDDFLQTNNIDFTMTDKVSLFAGVRKLSDAATGILAELSTGGQAGSFYVSAPHAANSRNYALYSRGSVPHLSAALAPANYLAPTTNVINAKASIGDDSQVLRIDGRQVAQSLTDQGTGNYGNYPLYIGRRAGTSLPFNGHIYGLIGIGKLVSDSETAGIEKELAKRLGVTL